ncbi:MAG: formate dehydrogenase accessory protein FdhE [Blastocatellia bacterium]
MWESRISRSVRLAAQTPAVRELLTFYAALLGAQQEVYEGLRAAVGWLPSGALERDLPALRALAPRLLAVVAANAPETLAAEAQRLLQASESATDQLLLDYWRAPSDTRFFAKAFLQPYAQWLIETGARPVDRIPGHGMNLCPHCGAKPQLSFLHSVEGARESGGRSLLCCLCLSAWPFRRVVCAHCGEERPAKLGYFTSPEYDHVRIEACDSCGHYIKGIDLTRLGLAVPLVDEVAAAPLDLWAREQGYAKIELNLVGL